MAEQAPGDFTRQFGGGVPQEELAEQKPASGGATLAFEKLFADAPAAEPESPGAPIREELGAASGAGFTQLFDPRPVGLSEMPEPTPDAVGPVPASSRRIEIDPAAFAASDVTLDLPRVAAAAAPAGVTGLFAPEVVSAPSQPAVKSPVPMIEFVEPQLARNPSVEQPASSAGSFTALFNTPPKTEQPNTNSSSFSNPFAVPVESQAPLVAPAQPAKPVLSPILAESLRAKREGGAFTQLFAPERKGDSTGKASGLSQMFGSPNASTANSAAETPMAIPAERDPIVAPNAEPTKLAGGFTQLFNPKAAAAVLNASQAPVSSPGSFSKVFAAMPAAPASSPGGFTEQFSAGPQTQAPSAPAAAAAAGGFTQLFNAPAANPTESANSFSQMFNASAPAPQPGSLSQVLNTPAALQAAAAPAKPEGGSFTQLFSGASSKSSDSQSKAASFTQLFGNSPNAASSPNPLRAAAPPMSAPGSFTQMLNASPPSAQPQGRSVASQQPAAAAPPAQPARSNYDVLAGGGSGATTVFGSGAAPAPAVAPSGPSQFTQVLSGSEMRKLAMQAQQQPMNPAAMLPGPRVPMPPIQPMAMPQMPQMMPPGMMPMAPQPMSPQMAPMQMPQMQMPQMQPMQMPPMQFAPPQIQMQPLQVPMPPKPVGFAQYAPLIAILCAIGFVAILLVLLFAIKH